LPNEFKQELIKAIAGFELKIEHIDAKFKLNQNRDEADYKGVFEHFKDSKDPNGHSLFKFMEKTSPWK
jgi:transcriptional regulator